MYHRQDTKKHTDRVYRVYAIVDDHTSQKRTLTDDISLLHASAEVGINYSSMHAACDDKPTIAHIYAQMQIVALCS